MEDVTETQHHKEHVKEVNVPYLYNQSAQTPFSFLIWLQNR